jgi:para-aminobenzoate synthetase/4-amino-4-deoxychorismate lyase
MRDGVTRRWLQFTGASRTVTARCLDEVRPALQSVVQAVEAEGLYAAGFVSYEAAPAFDPALPSKSDGQFPLLWFALFPEATIVDSVAAGTPSDSATCDWQPSVSNEEYRAAFDSVRSYIAAGDTYQVNLTYRLRAAPALSSWELFRRLVEAQQPPYGAFVDTGDWAICSASPELFFRLDGERIESRPMKGTAARGLWYEDDCCQAERLRTSPKERAENVMIVDMVRNDLGRIADIGSVSVPSLCVTERYPTVWQMVSTVSARTHAPLDRVFEALFPPASITGAPKCRTMEIIGELETTPRRVYTGAIGFIAPGRRAQFNVAIRTVLVNRQTSAAEYGVGGGIVWDSQCANEQQECRIKSRVLANTPPHFDLLETLRWSPDGGFTLLDEHIERLKRSAVYFGFNIDIQAIADEMAHADAGWNTVPQRVRVTVSRTGKAQIEAVPLVPDTRGFADIAIAGQPIDTADVFLYHKTTHRRVYREALDTRPGFADVILFNAKGEVTESTIANLAVEIDGVLYTPPVSCGLLAGTLRRHLLADGTLRERVILIEELRHSPRVCLLNSVRGMHAVNVICDGRPAAAARTYADSESAQTNESGRMP